MISEVLRSPGPTHSVVDFMAALVQALSPGPRVALLGFAGGGVIGPLRALAGHFEVWAVDLNREGYDLFQALCGAWSGSLRFEVAEAGRWLRRRGGKFDMIVEDLSISHHGDVIKPDLVWDRLPGLVAARLSADGLALFNLLKPHQFPWKTGIDRVARTYPQARMIWLDDFENRLLLAGRKLPSAREISLRLRRELGRLGSRQKDRFQVRSLPARLNSSSRSEDALNF